jgi:hypothetical protein
MQQPSDEVLSRVTSTLSWSRQLIEESRELCKQAEHKVASARQAIQESRRNCEPAPTRQAFYPGALSR